MRRVFVKGRDAQWRPCRLQVEPLREVDEWMTTYRRFFQERFDRLQDHLKTTISGDSAPLDPKEQQ